MLVCVEKYSLSGCVTWTSRPSTDSTWLSASFAMKSGYHFKATNSAFLPRDGNFVAPASRRLSCGRSARSLALPISAFKVPTGSQRVTSWQASI